MLGIVFTIITQVALIIFILPLKFLLRTAKQLNALDYKRRRKKTTEEEVALAIRAEELIKMGYEIEARRELKHQRLKVRVQKTLFTIRKLAVNLALYAVTGLHWLLATFSIFFGMMIALLMTAALVTSVILPAYVQLTAGVQAPKVVAKEQTETKGKEEEKTTTSNSSKGALAVQVFKDMAVEEMGNQNSGHVSAPLADGAGKNYGKYSFTQVYEIAPAGGGGFIPWLKKNFPDLAKKLNATPASAEFDAQWRALGASNDKEFTEAQALYCVEKFNGYASTLKRATGVDINSGKYTVGVWSIFASMMNQRPAWLSEIWIPYLNSHKNASSADIIKNTAGYLKNNYNGNYASSIRNRYARQETKALAMTDLVQF